jgi:rhodanese-related sulfurtransferase
MGNEWRLSHLAGAVHIPLPQLLTRLEELPGGTVWVHCASGYRAAAATSLLARAGRRVVHLDDVFGKAVDAGLPIVTTGADADAQPSRALRR